MVKDKWEKEQMKRDRINSEGMSSLTDEQRKTLDDTFDVLQEFIQEYSEMFDVTSETARKLQNSFWQISHQFHMGDK